MARRNDRGLRRGQGWVETRTRLDGSIAYVARWVDPGGRKRSKSFDAIDPAEQHVRDMAAAKRSGRYIEPSQLRVIDIVNQYLVRGEARWKPSTYATYCQRARACIEQQIGSIRIHDLTTARVQHWIDELHRAEWSPSSIANAHIILLGAYKEGVRLGIVPINPVTGVSLPRRARPQHETWTEFHASTVLARVSGDPMWHALYRLALTSGMRPGEIRALRWRDLDLDRATMVVDRTMTKDRLGRETVGTSTKTGSSRAIALPPSCVAALRAWRIEQTRQRLRTLDWHDHDAVFTGGQGQHLGATTWQHYHERLCAATHVPAITLHEMRHSFATIERAAATNPKIVSEVLGHRRIQTTLDTYSHVSMDLQRRIVDALETRLDTTTEDPKTGSK